MTPPPPTNGPLDIEWASPVPTEVFADHIVMRPPNTLKERATRLGGLRDASDVLAVNRAEHALERLSQEFDDWMAGELERLEAARRAVVEAPSPDALAALYRVAHDLRGQAATYGFPLVGEIANGLCEVIERMGERRPPQIMVDKHVESIRAIVRENARSREDPLGAALAERLAIMRAELAPPIDGDA